MTGLSQPGDLHAAEATGAAADLGDSEDSDAEVVRISSRSRPVDRRLLLFSAILLVAAAQMVLSWLLLSSLNQLRDQTTAANGLQRCLISAQLDPAVSADSTAYRSAVRSCLKR